MGRTTQRAMVLQYMKDFGSITRMDAMIDLGCAELSSRIGELEDEGWVLNHKKEHGRNRYGRPIHWTRYSIKEQP